MSVGNEPDSCKEKLQSMYETAIKNFSAQKLTSRNAFETKAIDEVTEYMELKTEMVRRSLERGRTVMPSDFDTAGTCIDVSGKIYAHRVDALHEQAYRFIDSFRNSRNPKVDRRKRSDDSENGNSIDSPKKRYRLNIRKKFLASDADEKINSKLKADTSINRINTLSRLFVFGDQGGIFSSDFNPDQLLFETFPVDKVYGGHFLMPELDEEIVGTVKNPIDTKWKEAMANAFICEPLHVFLNTGEAKVLRPFLDSPPPPHRTTQQQQPQPTQTQQMHEFDQGGAFQFANNDHSDVDEDGNDVNHANDKYSSHSIDASENVGAAGDDDTDAISDQLNPKGHRRSELIRNFAQTQTQVLTQAETWNTTIKFKNILSDDPKKSDSDEKIQSKTIKRTRKQLKRSKDSSANEIRFDEETSVAIQKSIKESKRIRCVQRGEKIQKIMSLNTTRLFHYNFLVSSDVYNLFLKREAKQTSAECNEKPIDYSSDGSNMPMAEGFDADGPSSDPLPESADVPDDGFYNHEQSARIEADFTILKPDRNLRSRIPAILREPYRPLSLAEMHRTYHIDVNRIRRKIKKEISRQIERGTEAVSFANVYSQIHSCQNLEEMNQGWSIAMFALLQLANDCGLELRQVNDLSDILVIATADQLDEKGKVIELKQTEETQQPISTNTLEDEQ